jgi:hypothetical protein
VHPGDTAGLARALRHGIEAPRAVHPFNPAASCQSVHSRLVQAGELATLLDGLCAESIEKVGSRRTATRKRAAIEGVAGVR